MKQPICDFCCEAKCKWQFKNPEIKSKLFNTTFMSGYFAACAKCGDLLEAGRIGELILRVKNALPDLEYMQTKPGQNEFARIYSLISKEKEPFTQYNINEEN